MGGFERRRDPISQQTADAAVAAYRAKLPDPLLLSSEEVPRKLDHKTARAQGFTGNQCSQCYSMRMQVSGHCEVCQDCGSSSGCS